MPIADPFSRSKAGYLDESAWRPFGGNLSANQSRGGALHSHHYRDNPSHLVKPGAILACVPVYGSTASAWVGNPWRLPYLVLLTSTPPRSACSYTGLAISACWLRRTCSRETWIAVQSLRLHGTAFGNVLAWWYLSREGGGLTVAACRLADLRPVA